MLANRNHFYRLRHNGNLPGLQDCHVTLVKATHQGKLDSKGRRGRQKIMDW